MDIGGLQGKDGGVIRDVFFYILLIFLIASAEWKKAVFVFGNLKFIVTD